MGSFGRGEKQKWYTKLLESIEYKVFLRLLNGGSSTDGKSRPMGAEITATAIKQMIREGKPSKIEMALVVGLQRQSIGRASEASKALWTNCYWDYAEEALCMQWNMQKVHKTKLISYSNDRKFKYLDVYFLFGMYYMIGGGRRTTNAAQVSTNIVLPHFADMKNPANKLNVALKASLEAAGLPTEKMTATSIRSGAINDVTADTDNCTFTHLVMRSGHDFTNMSALFEYVWQQYQLQAICGRSLAGWKNAKSRKKSISLAPVYKLMDETQLDNFRANIVRICPRADESGWQPLGIRKDLLCNVPHVFARTQYRSWIISLYCRARHARGE